MSREDEMVYFHGGPWNGRRQFFPGLIPEVWFVDEPQPLSELNLIDTGDEDYAEATITRHAYYLHQFSEHEWAYLHESIVEEKRLKAIRSGLPWYGPEPPPREHR
jgi:hypothetical protein